MLESILTALGLSKGATIGGFIGALVSLRFIENLTWKQRVPTVLGGMFAAAYVTPLVIDVVSLSPKLESAISFLIGVFGMSIAAACTKAMPEVIKKVMGRFPGGGSNNTEN